MMSAVNNLHFMDATARPAQSLNCRIEFIGEIWFAGGEWR